MSAGPPTTVPPDQVAAGIEALRGGRGAYRLARDVRHVHGPDALAYLQGQCSQDLDSLAVGRATGALLLSPEGKVDAAVRVTRVAEDGFLIDTDAGFGSVAEARLRRFKLRSKLEIDDLDWECVALRGDAEAVSDPSVVASLVGATDGVAGPPAVAVDATWLGWAGRDVLRPRQDGAELPAGFAWCPAEAWAVVRIGWGLPVMGRELDERTIPAEVPGLVPATVSFTKGCYTGQELVARLDARGNKVARHLRGLVVAGPSDDRAPDALVGATITASATDEATGAKAVGAVTSSAFDPHRQATIALAYLHRSTAPGDVVALAGGQRVVGGPSSATVVELPWPEHG